MTHLDKSEYASYPKDPDDPKQGRTDGEVGENVLKEDPGDGGEHQDEVEQVPWHSEVVVAETDDLDDCLCVGEGC